MTTTLGATTVRFCPLSSGKPMAAVQLGVAAQPLDGLEGGVRVRGRSTLGACATGSCEGRHYRCTPTDVLVPPPPLQQPRVPVWVVGAYPAEKSLARAARWDGLLPAYVGDGPETAHGPDALVPVVQRVREFREGAGLP